MSAKSTARKSAATKPANKRGNMKPAEIKPLVIAARKAFDIQERAGLTDGLSFDAWRHDQCMQAVSKPGITSCHHGDFRPLLAHFQTLAGDDASAFENHMRTGKPTDHAAPGDTHEARRILAHAIAERLADHNHLANSTIDQLLAEGAEAWHRANPEIPFPGPNPDWLSQIRARKAAIESKGKGPITVGYLVYLVRQKTRRPDLTLGRDWQAGLADRCTAHQLTQIRDTIINRIAAVEGTGSTRARNKSQRKA